MSAGTSFDVGITTLTDVDAISQIAFDIRDMADHIGRNEFIDARRIYEFGKHAVQYDRFGRPLDEFLSLRGMATHERGAFDEDPSYLFQLLGMADAGQAPDQAAAVHGGYADAYITEQLNDFSAGTLGAQAATVLVVSMYASHQLWAGMLDCFAVMNGYSPDADETGKLNPKKAYDNFIALYIGAGQTLAPAWKGDMLYELAQAGAMFFDTQDSEGEATVNSNVKTKYQSIQRKLAEEGYCQRDESIETLWRLTNEIMAQTSVPLVQMLIHSLKQDDQAPKVRMYALAVVPQLSRCRPSVHAALKDYLLDEEYDKRNLVRIVDLLQQSYDCLGITCEDVGTYQEGTADVVAECAGYEENHPMASFVPKAGVRSMSKIDLDILAIEQLLKFPSTSKNKMAQLYFQNGGVVTHDDDDLGLVMSLGSMAQRGLSSEEGQWSPYYSDYVDYFKRDKFDYAAIMESFASDNDPEQRRAYIVNLIQYSVVPEYMMSLIGLTLQLCRDEEDSASPSLYWDAFAALYIGSLEGISASNSNDDGMMLWQLANNRARQFNTQNDDFVAKVNMEMTDLLFAGQDELERRDCTNFDKTASRALHLMLVPLIQSTIWHAIQNDKLGAGSTEQGLAVGEAMAFSVLPIVAKYDTKAAAVIERNMVRVDGIKPVSDGPQAVANAFYTILSDLGWGCDYIGQAEGIDACEQFDGVIVKSAASMLSSAAILLVGFVSVVLCI